jgi:hypothetical protein
VGKRTPERSRRALTLRAKERKKVLVERPPAEGQVDVNFCATTCYIVIKIYISIPKIHAEVIYYGFNHMRSRCNQKDYIVWLVGLEPSTYYK